MGKRLSTLSILSIFQTFMIVVLIVIIGMLRMESRRGTTLVNDLGKRKQEATSLVDKENVALKVNATLVWWDQDNGISSIRKNAKFIHSVSPYWFQLTSMGEVEPFTGAEDADLISYIKSENIKIFPIIANEFKREPLARIISDEERRRKHIKDLSEVAVKYDGISLNYENLNQEDKENYTEFVKELAEILHKKDKTLRIHLHAKTDKEGSWNGPQAQDWIELGKYADVLKIMAYDYHWATSEAGPIAPNKWVEDVTKIAISLIPKDKVYLGVPLYGYNWIKKEGEGVTYSQVQDILKLNKAKVIFDEKTKSPHFSYNLDEKKHRVWFENGRSISYKLEIAKEHKIGGVDFFRLGGEDGEVWKELE